MRYYKLYKYVERNEINILGNRFKKDFVNYMIIKEVDGKLIGLKGYAYEIDNDLPTIRFGTPSKNESIMNKNSIIEQDWLTEKNDPEIFNKFIEIFEKESKDIELLDTFERVNDVLNYIELEKLIS